VLQDLHDLLQHYEESQVRFEDDDNLALYSDSWSNSDSSAPNSPQVLSRQLSVDTVKKRNADDLIVSDDDDLAAFDTSVLRNHSDSDTCFKKLKLSTPTTPTFADIPTVTLSEEDFLAQANALFASAGNQIAAAAVDCFWKIILPCSHANFYLPIQIANQSNVDKPYKCPVLGCDKAYKNPNGLKYHNQHGHCNVLSEENEQLSSKPYQCTIGECGKRYKNLNGLKYHIEHSHMAALNSTLAAAAAASFGPSPLMTPETSPLMSSLSSMN
jgi:hypothetical protein